MKRAIIVSALFVVLLFSNIAFATDSPLDILKGYYEADKNENIDMILELTDFSHIDVSEREKFKSDLKRILAVLARAFDTKSYSITNERVLESGDDALIFYHLKAELQEKSGKIGTKDDDYVAVMHRTGSEWKMVYMQPKAIFEQNIMLTELTKAAGNSIEEVIVSEKEPEVEVSNILQKIIDKIINFIKNLFGIGKENINVISGEEKRISDEEINQKRITTQEATKAYQEYIEAYNNLTNLMSQGKGDTAEAQDAYQKYKQTKKRYEQLAAALKNN